MNLKQAVAEQHIIHARLQAEIEAEHQAEANYWRTLLDSEESDTTMRRMTPAEKLRWTRNWYRKPSGVAQLFWNLCAALVIVGLTL